jgi:hypothetical protein
MRVPCPAAGTSANIFGIGMDVFAAIIAHFAARPFSSLPADECRKRHFAG